MQIHYIWFGLGAVLVILELLSGTFYLLVLAAGMVVAGLSALSGLSVGMQIGVAALASIVGCLLLNQWHRRRQQSHPKPEADSAVNLDVGSTVSVSHWNTDRTTLVRYRGAEWQAVAVVDVSAQQLVAGQFKVVQVVANRLHLAAI